MPKRGILNRSKLKPRRKSISPRGLKRAPQADYLPIIVEGKKLNRQEAKVWRYLQKRPGEDWHPQVPLAGGNVLGGAQADFASKITHQIIEVDGPFHDNIVGQARDFWRNAVRAGEGFNVVRFKSAEILSSGFERLAAQRLGQPGGG
jgi:very-short-patch-repair endonuclease